MPYGNQQGLIGEGMDPRLLQQDFSGYADAARIQAAGVMNAANTVTTEIKDYQKEQKQAREGIAKGKAALQFAKTLKPELAGQIDELNNLFKDQTMSPSELGAIGNDMGEYVAALIGEERYQKEYSLKQQEMTMRNNEYSQGAKMDNVRYDAAINELDNIKRIEEQEKRLGPGKLAAVEEAISKIPESKRGIYTKRYFEEAKTLDPRSQNSISDKVAALLTPEDRKRVYQNIPVTMSDGTPGELPALIDPISGSIEPITLNGAMPPMDGGVLPQKPGTQPDLPGEIMTDSGEVLPANEAKLVEGGKTVDVWEYQGRKYVQTKPPVVAPPPSPGITAGRSTASPPSVAEQIAVKKYNDEQVAAAQKDRTAASEARGFVDTLNELERHPGFSNLFGSNVGVPTWMPGSSGADAKAILGKVQGKAFLEAIQKMKGMGALSEKEGETATKAYSALTPSMSEGAAKKEIATLKAILAAGAAKASAMEATADPVTSATSKLQGLFPQR